MKAALALPRWRTTNLWPLIRVTVAVSMMAVGKYSVNDVEDTFVNWRLKLMPSISLSRFQTPDLPDLETVT